jgi:hypothetical protein
MWLKVFAGLLLTAVVSFAVSNVLLDGPDPEGWWNFVPGMIFYASIWLIVVLALVLALREVVANPIARWRAGKTSN